MDAHMWIEHEGKVIDYTDEQLKSTSSFGTDDIVRKPFSVEQQRKVYKNVLEMYVKKHELLKKGKKPQYYQGNAVTLEWFENDWWQNTGHCFMKALTYKKYNPTAKIVSGSLGFVQPNGEIFYEYG